MLDLTHTYSALKSGSLDKLHAALLDLPLLVERMSDGTIIVAGDLFIDGHNVDGWNVSNAVGDSNSLTAPQMQNLIGQIADS